MLVQPYGRVLSFVGLVAVSCVGVLYARPAHADVYVYVPGPPPPPPPRAVYYYPVAPPPPPPREASHALVIGVDVEGAVPVNIPQSSDGNNLKGGGGIKLRVGEQIRLGRGIRLIPELGYGYDHLFANDDAGNSYSWDMNRVFGGVRLSFGRWLVPVLYAHAGYGWRASGDPNVPNEGGLALDAGGALDLRVIPHFGIGAHLEYSTIAAGSYAPDWVALGLHADITF